MSPTELPSTGFPRSGTPPPPPPRSRRRGCLLWLLLGSVALAALFLGLLAAVFSVRGGGSIPEGAVLTVDATGAYPEALPHQPLPFLDPGRAFPDLLDGIVRAAEDPGIAGLHLEVGATSLGWARARSLREAALRFAATGKPVTARLEYADLLGYYLASAAGTIHAHPLGQVGLFGVSAEVVFYGDLLEKIGVEAQAAAIGAYKTSPQVFTRSDMTPEHREQLGALAEAFRAEAAAAVASGRGLEEEEADRLLSAGPVTAAGAVERGLVDVLSYGDELEDALVGERVSLDRYLDARSPSRRGGGAKIAVVRVHGTIAPGESRQDVLLGTVAGAETVARALDRAREDDSVDAVVLRIDSPGGVDTASDTIWRAAARADEVKPVVASFGDVAASGGYWVATAARRIWASPLSITGSIGIYAIRPNLAGLYGKLGLAVETVAAGEASNWTSPARPLDDREMTRLRENLSEGYRVFLERVAAARGITPEEVDRVGQGRVFTGARAVSAGLVDELGGLPEAARAAAAAAGFDPETPVEIVPLPRPPSLLEMLEAEFPTGTIRDRFPLLHEALRGARLALLPFVPDFR